MSDDKENTKDKYLNAIIKDKYGTMESALYNMTTEEAIKAGVLPYAIHE
jgi:hypothetical protein